MSSKKNPEANDGWETPDDLRVLIVDFAKWLGFPGITLDPCTTKDNPMQAEYIRTPECDPDGLTTDWFEPLHSWARFVYNNPPYRAPWFKKIVDESAKMSAGDHMVDLIPGKPCTDYFQEVAATADGVVFIRGRVIFNDPETHAPRINAKTGQVQHTGFGSALVYHGAERHRFYAHFGGLGWTV